MVDWAAFQRGAERMETIDPRMPPLVPAIPPNTGVPGVTGPDLPDSAEVTGGYRQVFASPFAMRDTVTIDGDRIKGIVMGMTLTTPHKRSAH